MKSNPIFQVLVVSNATFLATGNTIDALATGQIGVFNAETNLSFDPAGTVPDKFYFAVGHATEGNRRSAGPYIPRAYVNTASGKAPVTGSNEVCDVTLTSFVPDDDTEYTIRANFSSGQTMQMFGYTLPVKSFTILTGSTAPTLTAFIDLLVAEINADEEALIVASNVGDTVLRLTVGGEDKENTIGGINPHYNFLRQFNVKFACTNGFSDQPTLFTISYTAAVYQEGSGYDIQQLEYVAGGWNGHPGIYRDSELLGLFAAGNFVPLAVAASQYYQLWLNYEVKSNSGGFLNYSNQMETLIAIPNQDDNINFAALLVALAAIGNTLTGQTNSTGTVDAYLGESATN